MGQQPGVKETSPSPADVSERLFQLIAGYRVSQMIFVAAKLGIADLLKDGPRSADGLAGSTGAHARSLYRLLRTLASFGIFAEDQEGRFTLTPLAEYLQTVVPGSRLSTALYFSDPAHWSAWGELMYSVTTGEPAFRRLYGMDPWEYRRLHPDVDELFNNFMTEQTSRQVAAVVAAYDFSNSRVIVDVAGGQGILIAAILQAYPQARGILCDAPNVIEGVGPLLDQAGVSDRCEVTPCDFFSSVPSGGDTYILKSIIHDWDDEQALTILKTCRREVPEDGRLLLVENVIPPGNDFHPGKMTDLQMLVQLGGRERSEMEYAALLKESGFKPTRVIPTRGQFSIVETVPV